MSCIQQKLQTLLDNLSASTTPSSARNKAEIAQPSTTNAHVKMEDVQRHIKNLLKENAKLDDIYNYISVRHLLHYHPVFHFKYFLLLQANVTEIDNNFIRTLTTAVVDSSLDNRLKLNEKQFLEHIPLLERYMDGSEQLQLQCLIAIQILINQLEHPQGKFERYSDQCMN